MDSSRDGHCTDRVSHIFVSRYGVDDWNMNHVSSCPTRMTIAQNQVDLQSQTANATSLDRAKKVFTKVYCKQIYTSRKRTVVRTRAISAERSLVKKCKDLRHVKRSHNESIPSGSL